MIQAADRALKLLTSLILLYLSAALIGALIPGQTAPLATQVPEDAPDVTLHLLAGPIHYDFLLPLNAATRASMAPLTEHMPNIQNPRSEWLLIGWGAREFYTTTGGYSDLTAGAIWRSFTGDASVLRVDSVGSLDPTYELPSLTLSTGQYAQLLAAITDSFARDANGEVIVVPGAGFGPTDRFFEAKGRFDMIRTCNIWIGRMLRQANLRFGAWTPTPYAVTLSLKWHH